MLIWEGRCGVCNSAFRHPKTTDTNPSPGGTFCPVCRENRRAAPGVVHFKAVATIRNAAAQESEQ